MSWESRFMAPRLLTVRPAPGDPSTALVVVEDEDGAKGAILDGATDRLSAPLPFPVGIDSFLTADREWVVALDDDRGSEVGHLCACSLDGRERVDLTPEREPYVVRGLDFSADGSTLVASIVDDGGYHLLVVPASPWRPGRIIASTPNESWLARVAADGRLVSADTTDHNPGVRRAAVTVYDARDGAVVAICDDLPAGPVRAVRFSPVAGDPRLLLATERSGFARPAIWHPETGEGTDYDLPGLRGEVIPLDWDARGERILVVHVEDGIHRLALIDAASGAFTVIRTGTGSYANPDVASVASYYSCSFLGSDGSVRVLEQSWDTPPGLVALDPGGEERVLFAPATVARGQRLDSVMVTSRDGTPVQLWWAAPRGRVLGTVLDVHGGPNLVSTDRWSPAAQTWLEEGFAYASLNYRGSVTFGRAFREGFWGCAGDREIEDVEAALDWLRGRGLAAPASTFITGASYGGHLSLLSVGRLPDRFAGALALVAMADWSTALDDANPAIRTSWVNFLRSPPPDGGEPMSLDAVLARFSPLSYVGAVTASVWMSQGARDTRTPPAQAQRYADALRAHGGDVVIEFFDAGHEPVGIDGRVHSQRRMLELAHAAIAGRRWDETAQR